MIYVVPSLKAKEKLQCEGKAWAESQGFAYVPRGKRTIQDLMDEYGEDFLVYSSRGPQIDRPEGSHFFSLNMAELRIQNLRKGQRDHLLEALMGVKENPSLLGGRAPQSASLTAPAKLSVWAAGPNPPADGFDRAPKGLSGEPVGTHGLDSDGFSLSGRTPQSAELTAPLRRGADVGAESLPCEGEGDRLRWRGSSQRTADSEQRPAAAQPPISVLDCTCGFGADAAVASFGLPAGSRVDALEVSPLLEAVTAWGFSHFIHKKDDVTAALRRISLRCGDYRDYLLSDDGLVYDVLYFDPMFQRPVEASCQFQPVRAIMEHGGLTRDLIERALQKARRRVVIKERDFHQLCRDFPDVTLYGGKYSRIGYAVLECDSWKK